MFRIGGLLLQVEKQRFITIKKPITLKLLADIRERIG